MGRRCPSGSSGRVYGGPRKDRSKEGCVARLLTAIELESPPTRPLKLCLAVMDLRPLRYQRLRALAAQEPPPG